MTPATAYFVIATDTRATRCRRPVEWRSSNGGGAVDLPGEQAHRVLDDGDSMRGWSLGRSAPQTARLTSPCSLHPSSVAAAEGRLVPAAGRSVGASSARVAERPRGGRGSPARDQAGRGATASLEVTHLPRAALASLAKRFDLGNPRHLSLILEERFCGIPLRRRLRSGTRCGARRRRFLTCAPWSRRRWIMRASSASTPCRRRWTSEYLSLPRRRFPVSPRIGRQKGESGQWTGSGNMTSW